MHVFISRREKIAEIRLSRILLQKKVKNSQRIRSIVVKYLINTEKKKKLEILMDLNVKRVQMQLCAIKICHSLHLHLVPDTTIQKKVHCTKWPQFFILSQ